ncbi:MAG: leucine-rich repeat domain-containing protein [Metamycoplasmataceae bacterium]
MKSKKNNKNILLGLLSIIGLGSILGTSSVVLDNENKKLIENTLILENDNINNPQLLDQDLQSSNKSPRISQFLGTTLTKADVIALEWHTKNSITLQDWRDWAPNVTTISSFSSGSLSGAAFYQNTTIVNIEIPKTVKTINYGTFNQATNLRSVVFENDSDLEHVAAWAFASTGFDTIEFPDTVNFLGASAFAFSKIKTIQIPGDLAILSGYLFNSSELHTITFSDSSILTTIQTSVFVNTKLTAIDVPNTVTTLANDAFRSTWSTLTTNIKILDTFKGANPATAKYGFTNNQWAAIQWKTFSKPFLGTVLTKFEVIGLGWHTKTHITLNDWLNDAPNVTQISPTATGGTGGNAAFSGNNVLQQIVIPPYVRIIHFASFYNTTSLNSITFMPTSTGGSNLTTLGNTAFRSSALSSINLPEGITSFGNYTFANMPNLTSLDIPDSIIALPNNLFESTPSLKTINFGVNSGLKQVWNRVFRYSGIESINLPDTVEVINFDAFISTPNLNNISLIVAFRGSTPDVPKYGFTQTQWDNINWKFKTPFLGTILTKFEAQNIGWNEKTTITLADWANDAPNVTQIGDGSSAQAPFLSNSILTSIEIPNTVRAIRFASFYNAINLATVNFEVDSQITIIEQEVFRLSNLSSINLPNTLITIGLQSFMNTSLTTIDIPDSVTVIDRFAFANITSLQTVNFGLGSSLATIRNSVFSQSGIISIDVPNTVNQVDSNAFVGTNFLTDITMPAHLKGVNPSARKYGFSQTQWDNIIWKGGSFQGSILTQAAAISLGWHEKETITLADWANDAPNVVMINGAFNANSILKSIVIPAKVHTLNENTFYNTSSLTSVTFESGSILHTIGIRAFFNSVLENFVIPETVTTIRDYAFERSKIRAINIPTSVITIGKLGFYNMSNLSLFTFAPNSQVTSLEQSFIGGNRLLKDIFIPDSITNVNSQAFYNTSFDTISMPGNLRQGSLTPLYSFSQSQWDKITWRGSQFTGTILTKDVVINLGWHLLTDITKADWDTWAPNVEQIGTITTNPDFSPFGNNTNLESIFIPAAVKLLTQNAFINTSNLRTITFENNSELERILDNAFQGSGITAINLPNGVHTIGDDAFLNTNSLLGDQVSMTIRLRPSGTPAYGFTIAQWNSIVWRGSIDLTDDLLTSFNVDFRENESVIGLSLWRWRPTANMTQPALENGLALQYALGSSVDNLLIGWNDFTGFKNAISNYSTINDILLSELNIYARMYLPTGTGPAGDIIGNVHFSWNRNAVKIYDNATGTIGNFFLASPSTVVLVPAGKFIRTSARVVDTWVNSLQAEGAQSNAVKIISEGNVFDIPYWTNRGVKLEVRTSSANPWFQITQLNVDVFDASGTNKMEFRLSVINDTLHQIYGAVEPSTTPPGIMTPTIVKDIRAKKALTGVVASDLNSNKLVVSGTTHDLSITEDPTLYTVSGLSVEVAKTFFEIQYSYDGVNYFILSDFINALSAMRSSQLNNLILNNFRVKYEFTVLGLANYYSVQVANDPNALPIAIKTLDVTNVTKTIDVTSQINDVSRIMITGSTQNLVWSNMGTIPQISPFVKIEYGTFTRQPGGTFSYGWSETQPTSIISTTTPPGFNQFPLAIRFMPKLPTDRVQIGSIDASGVFINSDIVKGYEVDVNSIPTIINIDTSQLANRLLLTGYANNLNNGASSTVIEANAMEIVEALFRDEVELKYSISILAPDQFFTLDQLKVILRNYLSDFTNATSGILIFDNGVIPGVTINAKFVAKDSSKFAIVSTPTELVKLDTEAIITKVDLRTYINILQTEKTIPSGTSASDLGTLRFPTMSSGNVPFRDKTYEQIATILESSIEIEFRAPGFHGDGWVPLSDITQINVNNELFIRYNVKLPARGNVELSLVTNNDYLSHLAVGFKLVIGLPIEIQVTPTDLIDQIVLSGNTQVLGINDDAVYASLIAKNPIYAGKVQILYSIGVTPMPLDPNKPFQTEFDKAEFLRLLRLNKIDIVQAQKQITGRYALAPLISPEDFKIQDESSVVLDSTNVLLFINKANYYDIARTVSVSGTSSGIIWGPQIDELFDILSEGLILQYSIDSTVSATNPPNDPRWTTTRPSFISTSEKFLAIRLVTKTGYIFEEPIRMFSIDTSNILLIMDVQSSWLDRIVISGNTRNIIIDTVNFNQFLETQNVPGWEHIRIQYFFGGTVPPDLGIPSGTEWFSASQIITIFERLRGAKNIDELILFRNALRARYSLTDEGFKDYRFMINGVFTDKQFPDNPLFYRDLVTATVNPGFKGYINLDLINRFTPDDFSITGSDKLPELVVSSGIANMLDYYKNQSITPFDIYYTNIKDDFSAGYRLFNQNGFISQFVPGFIIHLDPSGKALPIWFKMVARPGYDIWENNILLSTGKTLEISNFNIQPKVTNPLTTPPDIRFNAPDGSRFYQSEGSFSVYVSGTNILVDSTFLNTEYPLVKPDVLKLEYNISDFIYTPEEMEEVKNDPSKWTDILPTNLRVGQYVMTRVAINNDIFQITGGDAMTPQIRVKGLLVRADQLVASSNVVLANNDIFGYSPLDGQAKIEVASIEEDSLGNYLGANLQMSVDTIFYRDTTGKIITDLNGIPIVFRDETGATISGYYLDQFGNFILDANGQPIPIWVVEIEGVKYPAPPMRSGIWQTPMTMTDWTIPGSFTQDDINDLQWRLFRGQFVRFSFVERIGEGTVGDPDFIFDTTFPTTKEVQLGSDIKYIIPNNGINYFFDQNQLANVTFASSDGEDIPYAGNSYISSELQATRLLQNGDEQIYRGHAIEEVVRADYNDQIQIRMVLVKRNGTTQSATGTNIAQFNELQNGDVITISFASTNDNFLLSKPISPLTIVVKNLFVRPLDENLFENLRPNFNGVLNGSGSFNIRVTDPKNTSAIDNNELVLGTEQWYEYQVWNSDKTIKTQWTRDESHINNLVNGDKVEWKLVSSVGVIANDYYNTLLDKKVGDKLQFRVVNVEDKKEITVQEGIGSSQALNPDDQYPETSGWLVSGLKIEITLDQTQRDQFELKLKSFSPKFLGINQFGSMLSNIENDSSISEDIVIVWYAAGKDGMPRKITDFKEAGLSNGDKVWATIEPSPKAIENNLIIDTSIASMSSEEFIVSGLTSIVNSTTQTLIISLITASSVLLVGITGVIVYMKRNSKLNNKKLKF